jgi:hypothetical protein
MPNTSPISHNRLPVPNTPPVAERSLGETISDFLFDHKIDGKVVEVAEMPEVLLGRAQSTAGEVVKQLKSFVNFATASEGHRLGGGEVPTSVEALRERRIEKLTAPHVENALDSSLEETSGLSVADVAKSIAGIVNYRGFAKKLASDLLVGYFRGEDPQLTVIKSIAGYAAGLAVVSLLGEKSQVIHTLKESKKDFPGSARRLGGEHEGSLSQEELQACMHQAAFDRLLTSCSQRAALPASKEQLEGFKSLIGEDRYHDFIVKFPNPTQNDLTLVMNRPTWTLGPETTPGRQQRKLEDMKNSFLKVAETIAPRIVPMIASLTASDLAQGKWADAEETATEVIKALLSTNRVG